MILITGATGNIGRHLLDELVRTEAEVRALVRDPYRLDGYRDRVHVVQGDLDDPATLDPAMEGISTLFVLAAGPDVPAQDAALIEAAQRAGVKQVVMVSSLGAELGGIGGGRPHQPGERLLRESGLGWTLLHPSEFMTNTLWWRDTILAAGSIFVPTGTGRVGFVDPSDIAAVAARVLTTDGHDGVTYRITGPEALSTADVAAHLSAVIGRPVQHVDVPEEAFRAGMEQAGFPPPLVALQVEYCAAVKAGTVDIMTDDVPALLGRPARDYLAWAEEHAVAFAPAPAE